MAENAKNLRRSSRIKAVKEFTAIEKKNEKQYLEDELSDSKRNDILQKEIDQQIQDINKDLQKPIELFCENDVSGKNMYGFKMPIKRDGMTQKANVHRLSFNTSKSQVSSEDKTIMSSDSESKSEDSEFVPTEDETDTESEEINDSASANDIESNIEETDLKCTQYKFKLQSRIISTPRRLQLNRRSTYKDYHMKTDEYFENQFQKGVTSNHTLAHFSFTRDKLQELLGNQEHVTKTHRKLVYSLSKDYHELFPMWYFIMEEGYTLLLHGLGSKRNIINDFHKEFIADYPTLVVNGFFPSLTIKDILDGIIVDLLGLNVPVGTTECIEVISKMLKKNSYDRLYLLIHNIDGLMLRSNKVQDILSSLARIPNLCIMASVDHINAPLLWDHMKHSKYNFYWVDATTLLPYEAETSYESSLLIQQSGALALSSLHNVFLSLTSNAKAIYKHLIRYQLDNGSTSDFTGMAFKDLYRIAREEFLVSTDLALRAQLTEFIDHKLVRIKRNKDGTECLIIPLSNNLLKQFLEQHEI